MSNFLFNKYGNNANTQTGGKNLISQFISLQRNPGGILDILLQNKKINQQQYNDLLPYKNNPEAIGKYLINNGRLEEIRQAEQIANRVNQ